MKKYSTLLGAAVVGLSAAASYAGIQLQVSTVAINSTLANAGWVGYQLRLVADGQGGSTAVSGFDFKNPGSQPQAPYNQPQTNIGIKGDIFQAWAKFGTTRLTTGDDSIAGFGTADSFFGTNLSDGSGNSWSNPGYANRDTTDPTSFGTFSNPPSEDNNQQNGTGSFTKSPLADTTSWDYGVGTSMTASGAFYSDSTHPLPSSADIAFIIVPSSVATTIRGFANDQNSQGWGIDVTLGSTIPEPASVGLLALGGLGLLARRRRS